MMNIKRMEKVVALVKMTFTILQQFYAHKNFCHLILQKQLHKAIFIA